MEETEGELRVGIKEVQLDEHDVKSPDLESGPYACLTVSDTGTGMNKDMMKKYLTRFLLLKKWARERGWAFQLYTALLKT